MSDPLRVLLLGGTTDAAALGRQLDRDPRVAVTTSLAGRTRSPAPLPGKTRNGGFGGVSGLASYLRSEGIDLLIDATHPYADRISHNAATACAATDTPRLHLLRPAWQETEGDRWIRVADRTAAARRLESLGRRFFLSLGRQDLGAFVGLSDYWFLIRMIDPPDPDQALPTGEVVLGRGPFDQENEMDLLRQHKIDAVITKNSGGDATYAKIAAARELDLPVIVIDRPTPPVGESVTSAGATLAWLERHLATNAIATQDDR